MSDEPKIRDLTVEIKEKKEALRKAREEYLLATERGVAEVALRAEEVGEVEENARILIIVAKLISGWALNVQMAKNQEMGEKAIWVAEEAFRLTCELRDAIADENKKFEQPDMHMRPFPEPEPEPEQSESDTAVVGVVGATPNETVFAGAVEMQPSDSTIAIGESAGAPENEEEDEGLSEDMNMRLFPELDQELQESLPWPPIAISIVKLMAKAGTKKDGMSAIWSAAEIEHGLKEVHPEVSVELVEKQLEALMSAEIVVKSRLGNTSDQVYCLADNGLEEMGVEEEPEEEEPSKKELLAKTIGELLLTNQDEDGKLLPWTLNQLLFAARDKHKLMSMTDQDIQGAADECPVCIEVNNCEYPTFIHKDGTFEQTPLTPLMEELHGIMLREMDGRRMWRDYDIYGILNRITPIPTDHDEAVKYMNGILQGLIDRELVRHFPRGTDGRFKEDRWKALAPPEEEAEAEGAEKC